MDFALVPARPTCTCPEVRPSVGLAFSAPDPTKGSFMPRSSELHLCGIAAGAALRAHYDSLLPAINPAPLWLLIIVMCTFIIALCPDLCPRGWIGIHNIFVFVPCCPSCRPRGGIGIDSLRSSYTMVFIFRSLRQTALRLVHQIATKILTNLVLHIVLCVTSK